MSGHFQKTLEHVRQWYTTFILKKGYGEQNHRIYTFNSNFLFKGSAAIPFIARIVSADAMM